VAEGEDFGEEDMKLATEFDIVRSGELFENAVAYTK
jgi:hypothetical protein